MCALNKQHMNCCSYCHLHLHLHLRIGIPLGTDKERGMVEWRRHLGRTEVSSDGDKNNNDINKCYDMPYGMARIREMTFLQYVPFCPTFNHWKKKKHDTPKNVTYIKRTGDRNIDRESVVC